MNKTKMMKKNYEFRNVLSRGKYYSGKNIETFIQSNPKKYVNFLGIAVGVKIGKAVKRNQIKRLIRENYRQYENQIKSGYNIIFLWKKKANLKEVNYQNIQKDMKEIFKKAKLLEE